MLLLSHCPFIKIVPAESIQRGSINGWVSGCVEADWPATWYTDSSEPVTTFRNFGVNPLKAKRRPLYLKTQSVPRCKHFSSRL